MKGYLDDQTHLREELCKEDKALAVFNILLSPSRCGHFASPLDEVESILKKKLTWDDTMDAGKDYHQQKWES